MIAAAAPPPPVDSKPAATATPAQPRVETLEAALAEKDAALAALAAEREALAEANQAKMALAGENARQAEEIAALKAQLERSRLPPPPPTGTLP